MSDVFYEMLKIKYKECGKEELILPRFCVEYYGGYEDHIIHVFGKQIKLPSKNQLEEIAEKYFPGIPKRIVIAESFRTYFQFAREGDPIVNFDADFNSFPSYRGHGIIIDKGYINITTAWRGEFRLIKNQRKAYLNFIHYIFSNYLENIKK